MNLKLYKIRVFHCSDNDEECIVVGRDIAYFNISEESLLSPDLKRYTYSLKTEAKRPFESLVPIYQDTRRHIRKQSNHHLQLYKMEKGVNSKAKFL